MTLVAEAVSKRFGHVHALDQVDLTVAAGEVLALVGDNGAGKSTLMKVLTGVHRPDEGEIRLGGRPVALRSPADARRLGIASVTQDLAMVECLDVATNVFLGDVPRWGPFVHRRRMDAEATSILAGLKARDRSPRTPAGMLSAGQRQMVAFARALRTDASVILLDEPTAALGVRETAEVTRIIDELRSAGKAVIVVTHDIEIVFAHADRIQVLRLGRSVGVRDRRSTTREEIIGLIVGARTNVDDRAVPA